MNTSTAICVDLLVNVELHGVLLRHVGLVLGSLEGGEGGASGVLAFHVVHLSLSSLNSDLHVDPLGLGVVVLDVLGGGEGGVQRSAVHVKLLSLVPSLRLHRDLLRLC